MILYLSVYFFIFLILISCPTLIKSDEEFPSCDENCFFYGKSVTSETMKKWPKSCEVVCGNLFFTADTDLKVGQLGKYFKNIRQLIGNIKIEYTSLTSLDFMPTRLKFSTGSLIIAHNPSLTSIYNSIDWWSQETSKWDIINNTKLDVGIVCRVAERDIYADFNAYGNKKSCGCRFIQINHSSASYYPNCTSIVGSENSGLKITNISDHSSLSSLNLLKKLNGMLEIYETGLENISFLGNLETHNGKNGGLPEEYWSFNFTNIHDNPNLKRLGLDSLKQLGPGGKFTIHIANNHPEFCLTTSELQILARTNLKIYGFEVQICKDLFRKDGQKTCIFKDLSMLDPECQHIIGDIFINATNEIYVLNLKNTIIIHGLLVVEGTETLVDLDFLEHLEQVVTLERGDIPLIQFSSNKLLRNLTLPQMKNPPFSPTNNPVISVNNNTEEIFQTREECQEFQKFTKSVVKINGDGCSKLPLEAEIATSTGMPDMEPTTSGTTTTNFPIFILIFAIFSRLVYIGNLRLPICRIWFDFLVL